MCQALFPEEGARRAGDAREVVKASSGRAATFFSEEGLLTKQLNAPRLPTTDYRPPTTDLRLGAPFLGTAKVYQAVSETDFPND